MTTDPYTQEQLNRDEFPTYIAQGSILKVVFKEITTFNEEHEWTELLLVVQIDNGKFICVSFYTGNRWLKDHVIGEANGTVRASIIINLLKKTPNAELKEVRVIGHLSDIDIWNMIG